MKLGRVVVLLVSMVILIPSVYSITNNTIVVVAQTNTYMLRVTQENGDIVGGTAFAVNKKYFITNHHVIKDRVNIEIYDFRGAMVATAIVIGTDEDNDLALLKLNRSSFIAHYSLADNMNSLQYLDKVYVIGYPFGDRILIVEGTYQSYSGIMPEYHRLSAPIAPGNSGGPAVVYNKYKGRYEVIGVVSAHMAGPSMAYPSAALIIPIDKVHDLLWEHNIRY